MVSFYKSNLCYVLRRLPHLQLAQIKKHPVSFRSGVIGLIKSSIARLMTKHPHFWEVDRVMMIKFLLWTWGIVYEFSLKKQVNYYFPSRISTTFSLLLRLLFLSALSKWSFWSAFNASSFTASFFTYCTSSSIITGLVAFCAMYQMPATTAILVAQTESATTLGSSSSSISSTSHSNWRLSSGERLVLCSTCLSNPSASPSSCCQEGFIIQVSVSVILVSRASLIMSVVMKFI